LNGVTQQEEGIISSVVSLVNRPAYFSISEVVRSSETLVECLGPEKFHMEDALAWRG
jgi:sensor domain CHASE-containing protein